ncbi:hypothetical protein ScPMuIL_002688 [Solemya velum]
MSSGCVLTARNGRMICYALRSFSTATPCAADKHYKLLVVGGGTGGCAAASKFASKFGKGHVGIIEPNETHYYQPMWTLVGAGIKRVESSARPMSSCLPRKADWIKCKALSFDPESCKVTCTNGDVISYDYLVVGMGLQLDYHKIKGLPEAFSQDPAVCSNYNRNYVMKTYPALQNFEGGNAIFSFPNTPIKCAGAPQKIMYLAEDYWNRTGKRDKANIMYNTSLGVIFGVKKYADSLLKIVEERNIKVNYKRNLIEVRPDKREAVFQKLDSETVETETFSYNFLHVVPPMSAPDVLKESSLVDQTGYMDVNKFTLQHVRYPNIFGIGDCTNVPTSKTAAAVAAQSGILRKNLGAFIDGRPLPVLEYDGYTSCPLVTGYGKCIMAEFDFNGQPLETFPIDQSKPRRSMYHMKKDVMPELYWKFLIRGNWEGPATYRKLMRFGMGNILKPSAVHQT